MKKKILIALTLLATAGYAQTPTDKLNFIRIDTANLREHPIYSTIVFDEGYSIDWSKVNSLEDLKNLLSEFDFRIYGEKAKKIRKYLKKEKK